MHSRSYKKIDRRKGIYMPFGRLVEQYDILYNREATIAAGLRYAWKCSKMGGSWISWDGMADVCEFFHLEKEFTEEFTEMWKQYTIEQQKEAKLMVNDGSASTAAASQAAVSAAAAADAAAGTGGAQGGNPRGATETR